MFKVSEITTKIFDLFKVTKITNFLRSSHLRSSKNAIIQKYKKNHTNIKTNHYKKIIIIIIIIIIITIIKKIFKNYYKKNCYKEIIIIIKEFLKTLL